MGKSIRMRFLVTIAVVAALLLSAALYTTYRVRVLTEESRQLIEEGRDFSWIFDALTDSLRLTESVIYQYPLLLDAQSYKNVIVQLADIRSQVDQLVRYEGMRHRRIAQDYAANLKMAVELLDARVLAVFALLSDPGGGFPVHLSNALDAENQAFITSANLAINEASRLANDPGQVIILQKLHDLRYAWAQQVSALQVSLVDPSSSSAENDALRARVDELLLELAEYRELRKLNVLQEQSLLAMQRVRWKYERDWVKAAGFNTSQGRRADLSILRHEIDPIIEQSFAILDLLKQEMDDHSKQNVSKALAMMSNLSTLFWVFTGFIATLLLLAHVVFEKVIRRPIIDVTRALDAHGRGENYPLVKMPRTQETAVLVNAFSRMKDQVSSRQTRLESILDNAAEGIISVDDKGFIETFSHAAQDLFGFRSSEAIGRSAFDIIPLSPGGDFSSFMDLCHSPVMNIPGYEETVSAHRRDGSEFQMSVKLNKLAIEGRTLYVALVDDVSKRREMEKELRENAEKDYLTEIYNRRYFLKELDRVVENIRRGSPREFSLLYIDLDNFKYVNDTLGHHAGDKMLKEVTEILLNRHRKSDLLARLGGDEFALLIYDASKDQVMQTAEAYRQQLADYVFKDQGKVVQTGCSVGVTLFGQTVITREELLMQADIACHVAKRSGKNRVHLYEPDDKQDVAVMSEDMGWARRIRSAIESNRFILVSQPIVSLNEGSASYHEILLRMCGDEGEIIPPAGFISAAERFGLMRSVDRWVIKMAIKLLSQQLKTQPDTHFSINLSAESIGDASMLDVITAALHEHTVPTTAVSFEITETVAIANLGKAQKFLQQLRALGCRTALDDFGVGYSSFAYLKDLPVDSVKIDGSFVRDIQHDEVQRAMVHAMNEVAHAMGKKTIAEYVDSEGCIAVLREIGVDYAQGFYVGKPSQIDESISCACSTDDDASTVAQKAPVVFLRK